MQPRRQKIAARTLLIIGFMLGAVWLVRLDFANKIQTDVLELVPVDERVPELALLRSLAGENQARVALLALQFDRFADAEAPDEERRRRLGELVATVLRRSGAFVDAYWLGDQTLRDEPGRHIFEHRLDLLAPGWLERRAAEYAGAERTVAWPKWLAGETASDLDAFLTLPEAVPFEELIPVDPLLLVPGFVAEAGDLADPATTSADDHVLIWARMAGSPMHKEAQRAVFEAVDKARTAVQAVDPDVVLRWTAVSRFAAVSRERITREVSILNLISLSTVLGIAALGVRRLSKVLHFVPILVFALLGAWVITTLCFARVHVLVFVVGSLLAGVAIDYAFYLFLQPRQPGESYRQRVRRLLHPLLASALTTVLGFSLLLWSEFPFIRHLGVFVSTGLLFALAGALLWFAQVDEPVLETRRWVRSGLRAPAAGAAWFARGLFIAVCAVALLGLGRLHWHDDIRELEVPAPKLRAEDHVVRTSFGEIPGQASYLTRGTSTIEARRALEEFRVWHTVEYSDHPLASFGFALPTPAAWEAVAARQSQLENFVPALREELAAHGYDVALFEPFFEAWEAWMDRATLPDYDTLARGLASALHGPASGLMHVGATQTWFASVAARPAATEPPAGTATVSTNQLESLNRLFSRYRTSAMQLSVVGLTLLGASVVVLYGWRHGLRIFALPAGACLGCFGLFGMLDQTLNLFHLLGAFLGVCLSHDYAIFCHANAAEGATPPPSIRFSALTTAVAFGTLAFSQIPVVAALGSTVATIVVLALAMVEAGVVNSSRQY